MQMLALVLIGWSTLRIAAHWQERPRVSGFARAAPEAVIDRKPQNLGTAAHSGTAKANRDIPASAPLFNAAKTARIVLPSARPPAQHLAALPAHHPSPLSSSGANTVETPPSPRPMPPMALAMQPQPEKSLRASAWLFWRQRTGTDSLAGSGGQLGGSQAGVRIESAPLGPLSLYGRATAALERPHAPELALGVQWRLPSARGWPLSLGVERRIAAGEGGRDAMAMLAVTGFGPAQLAPGIVAESYVQAGMVGVRNRDAFIDGRATLSMPVAGERTLLGLSLSGGAQPGVARLDVGPRLEVPLTIGPARARVAGEWRQRVAGDARPASGMTLTIASDF